MPEGTKRVFISYSWAVQERVIELAERLIANGVDVVLDVYDLKEGHDKYAFMEQSVNDPNIDRVLIICDKTYTEKADNRAGGVGDETVIISSEVYSNMKQEKFIPVVFEVDEFGHAYRPAYLKSRIYIDLTTEDDRYETEYEKLLRNIYEKPIYKKPSLGKKPEWLENDMVDLSAIRDLIKQVRGYSGGNTSKADFLLRKASDEFVIAAKKFDLPEDKHVEEGLLIAIEQTKPLRDLFIDYCENLIYSDLPLAETVASLIERMDNELHEAQSGSSYSRSDFELYDFMIWELVITATAVMLHYEKFADLNNFLCRPYFLRVNYYENNVAPRSYLHFREYFHTIEEKCKPKSSEPRRFTMAGDMLTQREKKPILTKRSIANADLVLYQLSRILDIPDGDRGYWFPTTFVYHNEPQIMWQKLKSKAYCEKIAPLFGVSTASALKNVIPKERIANSASYPYSFNDAQEILDSIKWDEIATLK